MKPTLTLNNLAISVENKQVLNDINLIVNTSTVHAIMGPNGSGKSSLALTLMGHPRYDITAGTISFCDTQIHTLSPDKRAKLGMFLVMQNPYEIEGVRYKDFLRQAYNILYDGTDKQLRIRDFNTMLAKKLEILDIKKDFIERSLNVGFSGGEKKRAEMLQLMVLQPKLAILDEIDSGLDIDALKIVCHGLAHTRKENPDMAIILITHYQRILNYITPDFVHVLQEGALIKSGGMEIVEALEKDGYGVPKNRKIS